jgi:error-prone DNA polymerase
MVHLPENREIVRGGGQIVLEHAELNAALGRTLGVPIFQEQVMQIALVLPASRPGGRRPAPLHGRLEAQGRRQPSRSAGAGHGEKTATRQFSERIFQPDRGFGEYGS